MQFKAKYGKKNKRLPQNIGSYAELRIAITKHFPGIPPDFIVCYVQDGDNYDLESEEDFEVLSSRTSSATLYLRPSSEDFEESNYLNSSVVLSDSSFGLDDSYKIRNTKEAEQGGDSSSLGGEEATAHFKKGLGKVEEVEGKGQGGGSEELVHEGSQCRGCQVTPITGTLWKCLNCHEHHLCPSCYANTNDSSQHPFIAIQDKEFWERVNFAHAIRKAFDSDYRLDLQSLALGEWVSKEDIETNSLAFVSQVWKASRLQVQGVLDKLL